MSTYHLIVANLARFGVKGISFHIVLVPTDSNGVGVRPCGYQTEDQLRQALDRLSLSQAQILAVLEGASKDGYYWLPFCSPNKAQTHELR